ncbi:MAG: glycosyltransferase family 39 protein [Pseudomonadota bacterium]
MATRARENVDSAEWRDEAGRSLVDRASDATLGVFLAWAGDSLWRRIALLALIGIALFLPGQLALGPTDRDESRYAQASKQMLDSGDYVDIRLLDDARHKKPVGIYWAQAASVRAVEAVNQALGSPIEDVRTQIWPYRIPSLLGALLASLLTAWAVRPLIGPRAGFLAGMMTAGLLLLNVEARIAKTDAALLAAVVAAMGALARLWFWKAADAATRGWNVFYLWTALAAGVLLKGPVIFLPVIGVILWMLILTRDASPLRRLGVSWGLPWMLLLAAPWFIAIAVKTDGAFFLESLVRDFAGKAVEGQEAHGGPPGYHLVAFWGVFWPWTPMALLAIPFVWGWRNAPETAFLLGWIIPAWLIFEITPTKLPHYPLPTYPAICALAAAAVLDGGVRAKGPLFWVGALLWAVPAVALPLAIAAGPFVLDPALLSPDRLVETAPGVALSALALVFLFQAWRWMMRSVWLGFVRSALIGAALIYAAAFQFAFPAVSKIWISENLAEASEPFRACGAARQGSRPPIGVTRYNEASLPFLAGTDTRRLNAEEAAAWIAADPVALVWVEANNDARFDRALSESGATADALATVDGFNYSNGKTLSFTLFAPADAYAGCAAPQ